MQDVHWSRHKGAWLDGCCISTVISPNGCLNGHILADKNSLKLSTLTAELQRRIQSLEFRCFGKILGISYKDRVTNEHVRKTMIMHIKLKWYGHVTRSDGLTKVILQGTVKEGAARKRTGLTTSRSGPANPSQRLNIWHTTGMSGETW